MVVVDVLWALEHELFSSSEDRDRNTAQLMEEPLYAQLHQLPPTPAKSLK